MRRIIYLIILALAIAAPSASAQDRSSKPRTLYVTAESSKTGFVGGLKAENFQILENKKELPVELFAAGQPASVGFLFDVSGSVSGISIRDVNDTAAAISESIRNNSVKNEYFLIGFNRSVALLADWTADAGQISKGLDDLPSIQNKSNSYFTSFYDAFSRAVEQFSTAKNEKRILIMFTDGIDSGSKARRKEIMEKAFGSDIIVYSVTLMPAVVVVHRDIQTSYPSSIPEMEGEDFLDDITGMTGGRRYKIPTSNPESVIRTHKADDRSAASRAFASILAELNSQYSIKYYPAINSNSEQPRLLSVRLTVPKEVKRKNGAISLRYRQKYKFDQR
jgi:VWFA-related protein